MKKTPTMLALNEDDRSLLTHAGVTGMVFVQKSIDLAESCRIIEASTVTGKPKIVKIKEQLEKFQHVMDRPFAAPYTMCINSVGNDIRSKYVAAFLLNRAIKVYGKGKYRSTHSPPQWHTLTGSYADWRRDRCYELRKQPKPAMIVFSNITVDSSEVKMEKLRDLLEQYADVPRIVAITGMDPYSFFAHKLRYKLNVGIDLSRGSAVAVSYRKKGQPPKRRVEDNDDDESETKPAKRQAVTSRTAEL